MVDKNTKILFELVTKGVWEVNQSYDLTLLNSHLRTINCVAREWYDKKSLILVRNTLQKDKNDMAVIQLLLKNQINANVKARLPFLIENGWIEGNELSKKFLMQYKNFLLEYTDCYHECEICKILVKDRMVHDFCASMREEMKSQMKKEVH